MIPAELLSVYFLIFLLGASLFSYLITTAIRIRDDQKLLSFSHCEKCKRKIPFWALCPVFGYFLTGGACKRCGYRIPSIYPLGEVFFGFCTVFLFLKLGLGTEFLFAVLIFSTLLFIAIYDFFTQEIFSVSLAALFLIELTHLFFFQKSILPERLIAMLLAAGIFHFIAFFYTLIRNRVGLGEGDATLFGMIGFCFGKESILPILLLSALIGLVFGFILLWMRSEKFTQTIPFAPAMVAASYLHLLYPSWYSVLFL